MIDSVSGFWSLVSGSLGQFFLLIPLRKKALESCEP
jgi:hypothetical protein